MFDQRGRNCFWTSQDIALDRRHRLGRFACPPAAGMGARFGNASAGAATACRESTHDGKVPGAGEPIRVVGMGESSVSGVGLSRGDETVTAVTARALARHTGRPAVWRACGFSGATVRDALQRLVPSLAPEPADFVIVAFGVNDATSYRSPSAFADDLTELVTAARNRVGDAAVVVGGVAPLACFPALPWPLRSILGWRSVALQAAADRLAGRLPRLVVERFSAPLKPDLFAPDGFHPNSQAHSLWGEKIAALALPLVT